ncbi:hypothetical protein [Bacillus sp. P14.5]|nr:hypothetical protein [Bacillus sp. P14.5]
MKMQSLKETFEAYKEEFKEKEGWIENQLQDIEHIMKTYHERLQEVEQKI